jgi:ABC-2 type transport system permease protein
MAGAMRYVRLWFAFARFALQGELAFRGNFVLKVFVEILWLVLILLFYRTLFSRTSVIAGWREGEYLFFVGCYFAMEGMIAFFFLENCQDFSNQVRTGKLDVALLAPVDEQFLVSCRKVDWSSAPNALMGAGVMTLALIDLNWTFDLGRITAFVILFACTMLLAYSFLLILTASAVWMVKNQSLMELWWLFSSLIRYPREIFLGTWASPIAWVFTFLFPVMLVINVPANAMVRAFDVGYLLYTVAATGVMLVASRAFFRRALRRYRSASS